MSINLRQKYFEQFTSNCLFSVELTKRKNEGYTAGSNDPYSNFRFAAQMASLPGKDPVTVEQTILSRMADKISRMKSLLVRPEFSTADESLMDTVNDLFVYSNILLTWLQLGQPDGDAKFTTPEEDGIPDAYINHNWPIDPLSVGSILVPETGENDGMAYTPDLDPEPETTTLKNAGKKIAELFGWATQK